MDRTTVKINKLLAFLHKNENKDFNVLSGGKVRCSNNNLDSPFYGGKECGVKKSNQR